MSHAISLLLWNNFIDCDVCFCVLILVMFWFSRLVIWVCCLCCCSSSMQHWEWNSLAGLVGIPFISCYHTQHHCSKVWGRQEDMLMLLKPYSMHVLQGLPLSVNIFFWTVQLLMCVENSLMTWNSLKALFSYNFARKSFRILSYVNVKILCNITCVCLFAGFIVFVILVYF